MSWNQARAEKRIAHHLTTVPIFDETITLAEQSRKIVLARKNENLDDLSTRAAFVVEGAHLYGYLLDYDTLVADNDGVETQETHEALLRFLDAQYKLWDSIVDSHDADRVDYHGARLHAVVSEPLNDPKGQIEKAISLASELNAATRKIALALGFVARVRFGIDQGKCLALTTGRGHDRDTLFMGTPANYAAKLAADGDEEGTFLTENASNKLKTGNLSKSLRGHYFANQAAITEARSKYRFDEIERAATRISEGLLHQTRFSFFKPNLPLSDVKFADLSPSHTARMELASIFADVDEFTKFVDRAISQGSGAIKIAARGIHVIREELNDVLKLDFKGKRIRFIGDCIHGVIAKESANRNAESSIREAALCASGMKSSFELCQKLVTGISELGLAIGIEYGEVPITRLGNAGNESIRCAAGKAVVDSERAQQTLEDSGVVLGNVANSLADSEVRKYFGSTNKLPDYDSAVDLLGEYNSPAVSIISNDRSARPYSN